MYTHFPNMSQKPNVIFTFVLHLEGMREPVGIDQTKNLLPMALLITILVDIIQNEWILYTLIQ